MRLGNHGSMAMKVVHWGGIEIRQSLIKYHKLIVDKG